MQQSRFQTCICCPLEDSSPRARDIHSISSIDAEKRKQGTQKWGGGGRDRCMSIHDNSITTCN